MKVLVDHGSSHNLGDTAMLEGVVHRLLRSSEEVEAHVIFRPSLRTGLWQVPRVSPVEFRFARPLIAMGPFMTTRFLWRWSEAFAGPWAAYCFASLGRRLQPEAIRVGDGPSEVSLEDWCRDYDGYLVAGGGNLTDTFPGEIWRRCCLIHAFAAQGKPVVLSGQQIGPFRSRVMSDALTRALRKADFVGLREPTGSVSFCEAAGLPHDRFAVMGDDSFGIGPEASGTVDSCLERIGLSGRRFLAVNVRVATYSPIEDSQIREVAGVVSGLARRYELPVLVVPIALNEVDSDIRSGHRLAEAVGGGLVRVLDDLELSPAVVKGILGYAFGAVGVSYHFCTFSLSQGVPAVCINRGDYYSQKGSGLCRLWGSEGLSLPLGSDPVERSIARICAVFDDEMMRRRLMIRAEGLIEKWGTIFDTRVMTPIVPGPIRSGSADMHRVGSTDSVVAGER